MTLVLGIYLGGVLHSWALSAFDHDRDPASYLIALVWPVMIPLGVVDQLRP
ncbi:MAG: hypothetical protein KDA37_07470 [Planctomycetales bacterium]|nr:hypothetical protein [Planctomycetales bacterium]